MSLSTSHENWDYTIEGTPGRLNTQTLPKCSEPVSLEKLEHTQFTLPETLHKDIKDDAELPSPTILENFHKELNQKREIKIN
jgi:hypothetical protein